MAPHQLFPYDDWGGVRHSLQFSGELGGGGAATTSAHERALSSNTGQGDSQYSETCDIVEGSLVAEPSSHHAPEVAADKGPLLGEGPLYFSDLDDALDDDDDIEESSGLESNWQRRGDLGARRPGVEIFVGGLTRSTRRDMLRDWFEHAGEVTEVRIARDKRRRRCRGYGYVRFATSEQANRAIETMHRFEFKPGRFLGVLPSDENRTLFVGGLREDWSCEYICKLLKDKMPGLRKVEPIPDREDRCKIRTFCFLEFATHAEAAVVFNRHQVEPPSNQRLPQPFTDALGGTLVETDVMSSAGSISAAFERETRGCSSGSCHESNRSGAAPSLRSDLQAAAGGHQCLVDADDTRAGRCVSSATTTGVSPSRPAASSSVTNVLYGDRSPFKFDERQSDSNKTGQDDQHGDGVLDTWAQPHSMDDDHTEGAFAKDRRLSSVSHQESTTSTEAFPGWGRVPSLPSPPSIGGVPHIGGVPLVVGGAVLKVDWADPLRYHIHLNGGIKGPCAPPESSTPDTRAFPSGVRAKVMSTNAARVGAGALHWPGQRSLVAQHSDSSRRWQDNISPGMGHPLSRVADAGGRTPHQQHLQHSRHHSPHLPQQYHAVGCYSDAHCISQPSQHRTSYTEDGSPLGGTASGALGTEAVVRSRDNAGRGYTVSDPRSGFAMSSTSPRRPPYHEGINTARDRRDCCEGGGRGGAGPRHHNSAYLPAPNARHRETETLRSVSMQQPRFQSVHSSSRDTANEVRPSSAVECSSFYHNSNGRSYPVHETSVGRSERYPSSSSSAVAGVIDRGSSTELYGSHTTAYSPAAYRTVSYRNIGDSYRATRSWSMANRYSTGHESQQNQEYRGVTVSHSSWNGGDEALRSGSQGDAWSHDTRTETTGVTRDGVSEWIDARRESTSTPSSEATAGGGSRGMYDAHRVRQIDSVEAIGIHRSRTASSVETRSGQGQLEKQGQVWLDRETCLRSVPAPAAFGASHRRFSESEVLALPAQDRVRHGNPNTWPAGGAHGSGHAGFPSSEAGGFGHTQPTLPPSSSSATPLLPSRGPPRGRGVSAPGNADPDEINSGNFDRHARGTPPPGFSVRQKSTSPQSSGLTIGPRMLGSPSIRIDISDHEDDGGRRWLRHEVNRAANVEASGRSDRVVQAGQISATSWDRSTSGRDGTGGGCDVGRSWVGTGTPSVSVGGDGGDRSRENLDGKRTDSRVGQSLLWQAMSGGELNSSVGDDKQRQPSWSSALLPTRGDGSGTWGA